jgi:hypothetical protein
VNTKQVDRLVHGLCAAFILAAGGMLYSNSKTMEVDATVMRTGMIVGHDIMSERAIQTDRGLYSLGRHDAADFKVGQRYHLTLYKMFTDPVVLGANATVLKAAPAP